MSSQLFAVDAPGEALAEASGVFVEAPQSVQSLLPEIQRAELQALLERFAAEDQALPGTGATLPDGG
jgi:hypothetical protein